MKPVITETSHRNETDYCAAERKLKCKFRPSVCQTRFAET